MMKKSTLLTLLLLVSLPLAAQQRFYVSPSAGVLSFGSGTAKNRLLSGLTVGYEVSSRVRLDLSGGYAARAGNSLYISDVSVTIPANDTKKWIVESSIGVGFRKCSDERNARFYVPLTMRMGYNITPMLGAGLYIKPFIGNRNYTMTSSGVYISFRI
jgi:hypothetical protein